MLIDESKVSKPILVLLRIASFLLCVPTQVVISWRLMRIQLKKTQLQSDPTSGDVMRILELRKMEEEFNKILLQHKKTDVTLEISLQTIIGRGP
mgnify:CR=1 FL=1